MKTLLKTASIGFAALAFSATSASAFTSWTTFEAQGYEVKARYHNGNLSYIKAKNAATGETFQGNVTSSGVAVLNTGDDVVRISVKDAEKRLKNRTTLQDLALAN